MYDKTVDAFVPSGACMYDPGNRSCATDNSAGGNAGASAGAASWYADHSASSRYYAGNGSYRADRGQQGACTEGCKCKKACPDEEAFRRSKWDVNQTGV